MSDLEIEVSDDPTADDVRLIGDKLTAFNQRDVGPANMKPLAVLARNSSNDIVGGIVGNTAWGWFYVQLLWVSESERGHGLARKMLAAAEVEAVARGCAAAYIDTFNPIALKTYQKAGYQIFGELNDFPRGLGRTRTFLQKKLNQTP